MLNDNSLLSAKKTIAGTGDGLHGILLLLWDEANAVRSIVDTEAAVPLQTIYHIVCFRGQTWIRISYERVVSTTRDRDVSVDSIYTTKL
jgi:hypothetical protein